MPLEHHKFSSFWAYFWNFWDTEESRFSTFGREFNPCTGVPIDPKLMLLWPWLLDLEPWPVHSWSTPPERPRKLMFSRVVLGKFSKILSGPHNFDRLFNPWTRVPMIRDPCHCVHASVHLSRDPATRDPDPLKTHKNRSFWERVSSQKSKIP